jgi:hypothetical protein
MATEFGITVLTIGNELTPDLRLISGPIVVLNDLLQRFATPHNSWDVDRDYGCALSQWVNEADPDVGTMQARIEAECRKDERVLIARAQVLESTNGELTVDIGIQSKAGPFTFTLAVDALTVTLLSQSIDTQLGLGQ